MSTRDYVIGERVKTNCDFMPTEDTRIAKIYVNDLGTIIYVMENGQRLGSKEFYSIDQMYGFVQNDREFEGGSY